MKINPKKDLRDLARFNKIMMILTQQGFGHLVKKNTTRVKQLFTKKKLKKDGPKRLRRTLEKLGPTFIKLGQILSIRPDLLPKEYIKELSNLQDEVPPFSYEKAVEIIEKEFHKPLDKLFLEFGQKPIASASISQVYKAKLRNGQMVAVKVQRPNVKEIMKLDTEIMFYIAGLLEKHSRKLRKYSPVGIVKEFEDWTHDELDFKIEAKNAKRFRRNFRDSDNVVIPRVIDKYSTGKVLTLEYINGIELHNIGKVKNKKDYDIKKIMMNGFDAIFTQVFIHGFFHADPHPGNILILEGNKIGFVDFGIVGHFDNYLKERSIELMYSIMRKDIDTIIDIFLDIGLIGKEKIDMRSFKNEVDRVIAPLRDSTLKETKLTQVLEEVLDVALEHNLKPPVDFALFGKTVVELEGIGLEYVPNFRFMDNAKPFLERLIKNEFRLSNMKKKFVRNMAKYSKLLSDLPDHITGALTKIQKGTIKIDVEDTDVKKLGMEIDKSSNRLTYGMIITAFLITGALMMQVGKPVFYGYPIMSLIFFGLALIFLISLFVSIEREGKLL